MYFRAKDNVGVIVLTNGDPSTSITQDVATQLFTESSNY
jgi:hypothetical protein